MGRRGAACALTSLQPSLDMCAHRQTKRRTPHRVGCEVHRVLAGCVVWDMVAGGKLKQPYHVLVLGVEEPEAGIGLSVSYRTCRGKHGYGFHAFADFAY